MKTDRLSRRAALVGAAGTLLACAGLGAPPPEATPGVRRIDETFNGFPRTFHAFTPTRNTGARAPLVLGIHGNDQRAIDMYRGNHWARTLEQLGWFGVFPETDGEGSPEDQASGDTDFSAHLIAWALAGWPVDPTRVYAVGFSGGGLRAYKLAATRSDLLAAVACGSASIAHSDADAARWLPTSTHPRPLSVLHCHGRRDRVVPIEGGRTGAGHSVMDARDALTLWAAAVGATPRPDPPLPDGVPARCQTAAWRAATGHEVQLIVDPRLDHRWPGADEGDWYNQVVAAFFQRVPPRA